MVIQAELSLYPLETGEMSAAIERFVGALGAHGLETHVGPMSTRVLGAGETLFRALAEAFAAAAAEGGVVLVAKISNACPVAPGFAPPP